MALHDRIAEFRKHRIETTGVAVPSELQGVSKARIKAVLTRLALGNSEDIVDGVFALLDNETISWFGKSVGVKFWEGATTAHLACHIGILQRGRGKLDREGRDYWIKPLRDLGGIEAVLFYGGKFISGHPIPKSPNSAYRLSKDFIAVLKTVPNDLEAALIAWIDKDAVRRRKEFQSRMEIEARQMVDTDHSSLISACVEYYVPKFLSGYKVIYIDDGDGDRITQADKDLLDEAGVTISLGDAMPDVLLWNPTTDSLWVIEAVTSDGEVDSHKVTQLERLAFRSKKASVGFTTAYLTWRAAGARQAANKNLAINSYMWILEDASKHFFVEAFKE
jgi:hypothetical protein